MLERRNGLQQKKNEIIFKMNIDVLTVKNIMCISDLYILTFLMLYRFINKQLGNSKY